jgi:hypothetical protein
VPRAACSGSSAAPGGQDHAIEQEVADLLERCRRADPDLEVGQRTLLVREPFEIPEETELV